VAAKITTLITTAAIVLTLVTPHKTASISQARHVKNSSTIIAPRLSASKTCSRSPGADARRDTVCTPNSDDGMYAHRIFDRGEVPAIIFGAVVAAIFLFASANPPPSGIYSEHRNQTDTLQRSEDTK
jgi:hypothetical protein